ncbi:MAG: serine/threonine-protein kinase [Nitrospirota bacterium]
MTSSLPAKIGKYDVIGELGRGGMAIVYLGFDPFNNRRVAIKVALEQPLQDEESRRRHQKMFFNEARIAGMLDHPNILSVYDAGIHHDQCYIVMDYIEGSKTLKEHCTVGTLLSIERAVAVVFKCCKALDYAHRHGVIHRDIKPGNILLTGEGDVKIGDFGIAQSVKAGDTQTQFLGLMGSPCYMSPEQVREEPLTNQTDLFSLGVVMYELLTGRSPFHALNFSSVVRRILFQDPPPLRFYRSDIPKTLEVIVMKALSKKMTERYKTGVQFATDLRLTYVTITYSEHEVDHKERFTILRKLDFFREFHDSELWEVLPAVIWREVPPGRQITAEGSVDETFYIIVSGEAAVKRGDQTSALFRSGDCFGEISYLTRTKRTADLVAVTPVVLLEVNNTIIDQFSPACQLRFHKVFLKKLIERLSKTSEALTEI